MLRGTAHTVGRARRLRRELTLPERLLWRELRGQKTGFKFRKQHPAGPLFVLDFACLEARLAIEVDGEAHDRGTNPARDESRDEWLANQGFRTLRIPAREVLADLEAVVTYIRETCRAQLLPGTGRGTATRSGVVEGLAQPSNSTMEDHSPSPEQPHHQPPAGPPSRTGEDLELPRTAAHPQLLPGTGRGTATRSGVVEGLARALKSTIEEPRSPEQPLHQPAAGPPPRTGEELEHRRSPAHPQLLPGTGRGTAPRSGVVEGLAELPKSTIEQDLSTPEQPHHQPPAGHPPRTGEDLESQQTAAHPQLLPGTGRGTATRSGVVEGLAKLPKSTIQEELPPPAQPHHQPPAGSPPRTGEDL